jgi:hypothetical protein
MIWPFKRKKSPEQRLFETLDPKPQSREKRFAQWDDARRQRYLNACFGTPDSLRRRT